MEYVKSIAGVRKGKKKQVKGELDRAKQAEKKKRRLEKALATSAAICSELEKKKQKKKEEQQRLDEEGAAIAEAVALRVLQEEEDSHHSFKAAVKKDLGFNLNNSYDYYAGSKASLSHGGPSNYSAGWFCDGYGCGNEWGMSGGRTVSSGPCVEATEIISEGVSSLQIGDVRVGMFVFDQILRG
ncbi:hypothetical protein LguiA_034503 [Lonicera macranthoides]